jgi:polar amino acid transport system substrate-binding protein
MNVKFTQTRKTAVAIVASAALLAACGSGSSSTATSAAPTAAAECSKDSLTTLTAGTLTIATGEPAYSPWVEDDAPESGKGFESAVAYAVANKLGFTNEEVTWVRTTFDGAIAPGPKTFDFNLQQYSITDDRKKVVDFSSSYYNTPQAVISVKGSAIEGKTTLADLAGAKLGAGIGTTAVDVITNTIGATPQVFNDNAAAVAALKNGQIDGIVVDLPTALYLSAVEVENGIIVGQLPADGAGDNFGLLLAKDSPLTKCVSGAVDALKADGTLDQIAATWLTDSAGAPVLK